MGEVAAYLARLEFHPTLSVPVLASGVGAEGEQHVVGAILVIYCYPRRGRVLESCLVSGLELLPNT